MYDSVCFLPSAEKNESTTTTTTTVLLQSLAAKKKKKKKRTSRGCFRRSIGSLFLLHISARDKKRKRDGRDQNRGRLQVGDVERVCNKQKQSAKDFGRSGKIRLASRGFYTGAYPIHTEIPIFSVPKVKFQGHLLKSDRTVSAYSCPQGSILHLIGETWEICYAFT